MYKIWTCEVMCPFPPNQNVGIVRTGYCVLLVSSKYILKKSIVLDTANTMQSTYNMCKWPVYTVPAQQGVNGDSSPAPTT